MQDQQNPAVFRTLAALLSAVWTVVVVVYALLHAGESFLEILLTLVVAVIVLIVPIAALWGVERLAHGREADRVRIMSLEADLRRRDNTVRPVQDNRDIKLLSDKVKMLEAQVNAPALVAPVSFPESTVEMPDLSPPPVQAASMQPELPIFEPPGHVELSRPQIVRALNFPQDANDTDGFDLLRKALASRDLAQLLQAAEDCLNFLSQSGLYMDDLLVTPASAQDWRAFAKGGRARAALLPMQGIRDEAALTQVQAKMRTDPIFRDTALVLQSRFDAFMSAFASQASDPELMDLMNTRSGRAFVLFAQVSGSLKA